MGKILVAIAVLLCGGCAQSNVYDKDGVCRGLKVYSTSRPMFLVTKTDSCGRPLDVDVKYLPDLRDPMYVVQRGGLGKTGLKIAAAEGVVTSFQMKDTDAGVGTFIENTANAAIAFLAGKAALDELNLTKKNK